MTERDERDEMIDEAIEVLIDENTDGFEVVAVQGEDVHLVGSMDDLDDQMLGIWIMVMKVTQDAQRSGIDLSPEEVIAGAFQTAAERGYMDDGAQFQNLR